VLAEHERSEGNGGKGLEVQQQRGRRRWDAFEASHEQGRADRSAEHDREGQRSASVAKRDRRGP
jgi:hypothetical protein